MDDSHEGRAFSKREGDRSALGVVRVEQEHVVRRDDRPHVLQRHHHRRAAHEERRQLVPKGPVHDAEVPDLEATRVREGSAQRAQGRAILRSARRPENVSEGKKTTHARALEAAGARLETGFLAEAHALECCEEGSAAAGERGRGRERAEAGDARSPTSRETNGGGAQRAPSGAAHFCGRVELIWSGRM